jgi:hypothetical protein
MYHKLDKQLQILLNEKGGNQYRDIITEFYNNKIGKSFKLSYFFTKIALKNIEIGQDADQKEKLFLDQNYFLSNSFTFLGYRTGCKNDDIYDQNTEWFKFENQDISFTFRIFYLQSTIISIFYSIKIK